MKLYRFADFTVAIAPLYPSFYRFCQGYEAPDNAEPDFCLSVTPSDIAAYRKQSGLTAEHNEYLERLLLYTRLCARLPERNAMFFHAAVAEVDGKAYAFAAKSGTGKSTHLALWMRCYPHTVSVLNGDKPILRVTTDGDVVAYGTPWCGKEGLNRNASAPLAGICFLTQGKENRIRRLTPKEAVPHFLEGVLPPSTPEEGFALLSLTDRILSRVPAYLMSCTISEEAARLSYTTMTGGNNHENC